MKEEAPLDLKEKQKLAIPVKRPSKKKQKDKPKRPLSAYNFFFKEEREKILKVVLAEESEEKTENDPESVDFLDDDAVKRLKKEGGKVSFEEMGKIIGQRWKNIDPNRLTRYSELAAEDTERYKKEMTEYNGRQEQKMRSEALKPPPAPALSRTNMSQGAMSSMMDASRAGYSDSMQAYAGAAGMAAGYPYGGMDFSAYGMGMGGMYYGGYPGMGGGGGQEGMGGGGGGGGAMGGRMEGGAQYGGGMYGMMGAGGFQGMMGYGTGQGGAEYGQQQQGQQHPGAMDPSAQQGMYGGGYGGQQGWGQQ